jgi:hypothetical protein
VALQMTEDFIAGDGDLPSRNGDLGPPEQTETLAEVATHAAG